MSEYFNFLDNLPVLHLNPPNDFRKSMLQHADEHLTHLLPISYGGNDTTLLVMHYYGFAYVLKHPE